ncbi:glycosyltransferase [Tamlana sp. 2_MG-2023]|uniref:glycosyltransferase n=1 Tax=unclassified Tamlana TaxID=2614803 RepID=UPI0026E3F088|nr:MULTISPECIES: glycosyltransferase [unclassified Tamlana]MDO6760240.1 glycosyltransferase [Tamlana sp. 2_MG-2023]MDO6790062.1 glycosyltransferase [Tamlana sp. 1_MG-2023]
MKILHISTYDSGGAFIGANRLHRSLLKHNIDSKILVKNQYSAENNEKLSRINQKDKSLNIINRIQAKLGFPVTSKQKRYHFLSNKGNDFEIISFPFSDFEITKTKEYEECDIVHLHWVAGFLDYKSFFKKCKKPVVITLRDLFPIQGIFHYHNDYLNNKDTLGGLEDKMKDLKLCAIQNFKLPIYVVGISSWITKESLKSTIHKGFEHFTIPNCINLDDYVIYDKKQVRKEFNIEMNSFVISFVCHGVSAKRKGIDMLIKAISDLKIEQPITVLTAGGGTPPQFPLNIIHRHLGKLNSEYLNKVYGASDVFVMPSREEALGNVMLEAIACGTPVLATPVGGPKDVIQEGVNGLLSKSVSSQGLKEVIERFIKSKSQYYPEKVKNSLKEKYTEEVIASKYIKLYKLLIENTIKK